MRTRLRAIVPRRLAFDAKRLNAAIEGALNEAAKEVRLDFDDTVSTWDTPVTFTTYSRTGERIVSTKSMVYHFVNDGTKRHEITPKNAKVLAFSSLSGPKTQPNVIGSGQGFRGGVIAFAKRVMHPGTKPRYFNKAIKTRWNELLPLLIQEAIDNAL
jgi:hypothetical protein